MCIGGTCYSVEFVVEEETVTTVSISGIVRRLGGEPFTGVNVRVVSKNDQGGESVRLVSVDSEGRYSVDLEDGVWKVMACGSSRGFSPWYWEVDVSNGEVLGFVEKRSERLVISRLEHQKNGNILYPGENVILVGSGFGCSGRVVFELGEYGRLFIEDTEHLSEGGVKFKIPLNIFDLIEDAGFQIPENKRNMGVSASVYYASGTMISNAVTVKVRQPTAGGNQQGGATVEKTVKHYNFIFH